jgi:hypothetical protein
MRELAGCFVLLSNVPLEGDGAMDGAGLLRTYKGQYGVESDFAFLDAMGLDSNAFIDPGCQCTPIIPRKSA